MNSENLTPFSSSRAKKEGKKGGIASGKARQKKRAMRDNMLDILNTPIDDKESMDELKALGVEESECTYSMLLMARTLKKAMGGDIRAVQCVREIIGDRTAEVAVNVSNYEIDDKVKELNELLESYK